MNPISLYLLLVVAFLVLNSFCIITRANGGGWDNAFTALYVVRGLPFRCSHTGQMLANLASPKAWFITALIVLTMPAIRVLHFYQYLNPQAYTRWVYLPLKMRDDAGWFMINGFVEEPEYLMLLDAGRPRFA